MVSLIAASFAPNVATVVGTQGVLNGIAQSMLFLVATVMPAPYFERRLSLAMGVVAAASGVGGVSQLQADINLVFLTESWMCRSHGHSSRGVSSTQSAFGGL